MLALIGIIIVALSVIGGFLFENGPLQVLFQPAEFVIIVGAALGAFFIGSSRTMFRQVFRSLPLVFSMRHYNRSAYLELLGLLNSLFVMMRKNGVSSIERDVEHPENSALFDRYPQVAKDHKAMLFIGDTLRVYLTTGDQQELEQLMKVDMQAMMEESEATSGMISRMAESLPGLGIVAAVLGVILTMGQISQPPEILGHSIGAALVGTFLGVLLCYGFIGPMAMKLDNLAQERNAYYGVIRAAISAAAGGSNPIMAVEHGRRAIPTEARPSFFEMEEYLK